MITEKLDLRVDLMNTCFLFEVLGGMSHDIFELKFCEELCEL